jgi:hypothetical protein
MSHILKYQTVDGSTVLVEIDGEAQVPQEGIIEAGRVGEGIKNAVEEVQTRFEDALDAVRQNAQTIIGKMEALSDRPDEVEVSFGLKATGELGNFAVAKASAEANYTVKMTWKQKQEEKGSRTMKGTSCQPRFRRFR